MNSICEVEVGLGKDLQATGVPMKFALALLAMAAGFPSSANAATGADMFADSEVYDTYQGWAFGKMVGQEKKDSACTVARVNPDSTGLRFVFLPMRNWLMVTFTMRNGNNYPIDTFAHIEVGLDDPTTGSVSWVPKDARVASEQAPANRSMSILYDAGEAQLDIIKGNNSIAFMDAGSGRLLQVFSLPDMVTAVMKLRKCAYSLDG